MPDIIYTQLKLPMPLFGNTREKGQNLLAKKYQTAETGTVSSLTNEECMIVIDFLIDPTAQEKRSSLVTIPTLAKLISLSDNASGVPRNRHICDPEGLNEIIMRELVEPIVLISANQIRTNEGMFFISKSILDAINNSREYFDDPHENKPLTFVIDSLAEYISVYLIDHAGLYDFLSSRVMEKLIS